MEINKCSRCGGFYTSKGKVCPNCTSKDDKELNIFKSYLEENEKETSLSSISFDTGISQLNLNRFLDYDGFDKNIIKNLK